MRLTLAQMQQAVAFEVNHVGLLNGDRELCPMPNTMGTVHNVEDLREILKLRAERDALEARLEAMAVNRDAFREAAYKAISIIQVNKIRLPQGYGDECLAEIRAEAGRAGFVTGIDALETAQILGSDFDAEKSANEYAAKVRQGGE